MTDIDRDAMDKMSVAPGGEDAGERDATDPRQEAGQDESIARRLQKNPIARMHGSTTRLMSRWTRATRPRSPNPPTAATRRLPRAMTRMRKGSGRRGCE